MRQYNEENQLEKVICNQCKKVLKVEDGILKEGHFEGKQTFGYFSDKDGITHKFDLCEECYNQFIQNFKLPVEEIEEKEIF